MEGRGHPGVPPYDESIQMISDAPAATAVTRKQIVVGEIVERVPAAASFRPPGVPRTNPVAADGDALLQEIGRENEATIASMSTEEILEEQRELEKRLPPRLLQKWRPQ